MLCAAESYRDKLAVEWQRYSTHPNYLYWNAEINYNPNAEIRNTDYRKDEWVSIIDGKIIGYFCALIDKTTRSVADISVANFTDNPRYGYDFIAFMKYMRRRYRFVRWAAISGHPKEKDYEAILRHYGGRVVGTFKKKIRLRDGKLYDERWYEIDNEDRINAT